MPVGLHAKAVCLLLCQAAKLEAELAIAEQKVQEGEVIRRRMHNMIQVRRSCTAGCMCYVLQAPGM